MVESLAPSVQEILVAGLARDVLKEFESAIAGLPGFTDAQIIALLTEGQATDRNPPRPPMPPFRMSRQDAEAIVAYLRSR